MFGSHLSIAGSMCNALREAKGLGLDCVQVFTKNQQQWNAPALKPEAVAEWAAELKAMCWDAAAAGLGGGGGRVVSHASYLINLASPDDGLRGKSIALFREEVERCEALGIGLLVFHPGSAMDGTAEAGVARIAAACAGVVRETRGYRTVLCLENVAGAGRTIGRTFEELADLRGRIVEATGEAGRVGFCIDTCHAHAAGYDLGGRDKAANVMAQAQAVLGAGTVRALHLNDSKGAAGSRLDRHEHIGAGTIGVEGFVGVLGHAGFADVPKIMETPKGTTKAGAAFDTVNVGVLRAAAEGRVEGKVLRGEGVLGAEGKGKGKVLRGERVLGAEGRKGKEHGGNGGRTEGKGKVLGADRKGKGKVLGAAGKMKKGTGVLGKGKRGRGG